MTPSTMREMADILRNAGIPVTLQRVEIARVMLSQHTHLSADQVLAKVQQSVPETSRATVYNTLRLFREKKLVRELIVDPERIVFDSNTDPHYHLYNAEQGTLIDVSADELQVVGLPDLPPGLQLDEVDVIIRVRDRKP
ncbi:Fur family transcriptional regulator [Denitromonas iodatirespirans]|uniref:Ferric uptake regulation protein n=1 Tax=Denitromonas iodatirespirans TaxID=2795389 RepID=A0A944D9Q0_DENI1|nr:Fur family transcriptional regulator [Denitromonas iodatirespirans]MBT0962564.1 transcriptional repressor [Denitromonas iodatirespirans]